MALTKCSVAPSECASMVEVSIGSPMNSTVFGLPPDLGPQPAGAEGRHDLVADEVDLLADL